MNCRILDITPSKTSGWITILPVEVHYSKRKVGNGFMYPAFRRLITRLKNEPDTYIVFVGDLIDAHRPSMRERMAHIHAESERKSAACEMDDNHRESLESGIVEDLKPVKHKILGAVDGDHFVLYQNGRSSTQHILDTLKIPDAYLGRRSGWIMLRIRRNETRDFTLFKIFVRHGKGSSTTAGTDINALMKQSVGFAGDLYLGGHTHKKWVHSLPVLDVDRSGKIYERPVAWARAGSLLKGFLEGETTYAEEAEYQPLQVGYPDVYVRTGRRNNNIKVLEIKGLV